MFLPSACPLSMVHLRLPNPALDFEFPWLPSGCESVSPESQPLHNEDSCHRQPWDQNDLQPDMPRGVVVAGDVRIAVEKAMAITEKPRARKQIDSDKQGPGDA